MIWDKGQCPCSRCFILTTEFHQLGLLSDLSQRITKTRTYIWENVIAACATIYNFGSPIKSTAPKAYLKGMSLVLTFVNCWIFDYVHWSLTTSTICNLNRTQLQTTFVNTEHQTWPWGTSETMKHELWRQRTLKSWMWMLLSSRSHHIQVREKNKVKHEQVQEVLSRGGSLRGWARYNAGLHRTN